MCRESTPAIGRERGLPLLSHATRASPRRSPFDPQTRTDPRPPTRPHGARTQRARRKFIPFSFSEKLHGTPDAAKKPRYGARQSRVARYQRCGSRAVLGVLVVLRSGARAARASQNISRARPALNPWVIDPPESMGIWEMDKRASSNLGKGPTSAGGRWYKR